MITTSSYSSESERNFNPIMTGFHKTILTIKELHENN
jgi:hypothetical protein